MVVVKLIVSALYSLHLLIFILMVLLFSLVMIIVLFFRLISVKYSITAVLMTDIQCTWWSVPKSAAPTVREGRPSIWANCGLCDLAASSSLESLVKLRAMCDTIRAVIMASHNTNIPIWGWLEFNSCPKLTKDSGLLWLFGHCHCEWLIIEVKQSLD